MLYLWIIPVSFGVMGILSVNEESLNAIGQPTAATVQTIVHQFAMLLPLAFAGAYWMGVQGLFIGIAFSNLTGAVFGLWLVRWMSKRCEVD